jgi:hypothetical protein
VSPGEFYAFVPVVSVFAASLSTAPQLSSADQASSDDD